MDNNRTLWLLRQIKKIIQNFDQKWKGNVNVPTCWHLFRSEHHYEKSDRARGAIYSVEVSNYPFSLSTTLLSLYDRMFLWITESRYMIVRTFEPDFSKENSVWPKNPASRSIYTYIYIYIFRSYGENEQNHHHIEIVSRCSRIKKTIRAHFESSSSL